MINGTLRSKVDQVWNAFWTGGISNPLTVIEQFSYLLFIRGLDITHTSALNKANRLGRPIENPIFSDDEDHLRWSRLIQTDPQGRFELMRDAVFPFIKNLHGDLGNQTAFARAMKDATFLVPNAALLTTVCELINEIPLQDRDTKGDLYEYLLSKLSTAGVNGQFRTPRHIIKMMVAMMRPRLTERICDPSCGTAGFLMGSAEYLRETFPSEFMDPAWQQVFNNETFHGFDFDSSMLRIATMNMLLHGIQNPNIQLQDTLSQDYEEENCYDLILANPPFKGSLAKDQVHTSLTKVVSTKKTELLFIGLFLRQLKLGGRCACIVPDGVLFGSSKAHKKLRQTLIEEHQLQAVVSMPSGVFKPYAGVSTGILIFTKTAAGDTRSVWFYDMQADGFSLDDKRTPLGQTHEANNIPDVIKRFREFVDQGEASAEFERARTMQSFCVPKAEIVENEYDLSINRYKEIVYEKVEYDPPHEIIDRIEDLNRQLAQGLGELREMLG